MKTVRHAAPRSGSLRKARPSIVAASIARWLFSSRARAPLLAASAALALSATNARGQELLMDARTGGSVGAPMSPLTAGYEFSLSNPLTFDAVGVFSPGTSGLTAAHQVGLWNSSGDLLASGVVTNASAPRESDSGLGQWFFTSISPVTLGAGNYDVGALYPVYSAAGDSYLLQQSPAAFFGGSAFVNSEVSNNSTLTFPNTATPANNSGYFGPNLLIAPAYWKGNIDAVWTSANWTADAAGAVASAGPSAAVDVIFSAAGAARQNTTLGQDITIHSLTINDPTPVVISSGTGGPFTLTINGNAGTGILVNNGANLTINSNVTLAGISDFITVNGAAVATINGTLEADDVLYKAGTGTLFLNGANTINDSVNIEAGTLSINNSNALGTVKIMVYAGSELNSRADATLVNTVVLPTYGTETVSAAAGTTLNLQTVQLIGHGVFGSPGNTGVITYAEPQFGFSSADPAGSIEVAYGTLRNAAAGASGLGAFTSVVASTTVDAGATLDVNDYGIEVKNLQGGGAITLGSNAATALTVDGGSFGGSISGAGGLTKTTSGALTLTGASTYGGGTILTGGLLLINNTTGSGTGGGGVTVNGGTLGGSGTIAGGVTLNSQGVIAPGAGSPGVAGTTLHAGALLWNGGGALALQLGASGDQLALNGALTKGSAGAYTLDISIGTVSQTVYTLATFSGTNFAAGDFALALPAGYSGILEETPTSLNLALDAVNSFIFTVGGTLIITNTLTLNSGDLASPGGTNTITGGSLLGPNGLHFDVEGNLIIGSTVIGNVVKTGGGALFLDGTLYGDFQLLQGLLGGTGSIVGNLYNGGTVSPGDAPGTLRVSGNYTQAPGGLLQIRIGGPGATEHDLLTVGGVAQLAGTLQLAQLNNFKLQRNAPVVFLTAAGGVSGQFSTVISDFTSDTILEPTVVYGSNSVELEAVQGSFEKFAENANLTPNERSVAAALDRVVNHRRANSLIGYLDDRALSKLPGDFDRIAPEQLTSLFTIGVALAGVQSQNIQRRTDDIRNGSSGFSAAGLAINGDGPGYSGSFGITTGVAGPAGGDGKEMKTTAPAENRWGTFLSGVGDWVNVGNTDNARGYDLTSGGFTLGVDYKVTPNFAIGLVGGYTGTTADLTDNGRIRVNGGKIGLYGTTFLGGWYAEAAATGGYNSYDTHRAALQGDALSSADGGEVNALFGGGYDIKRGALTFGPTATFDYTYVGLNGFTERGSLAPLNIHGSDEESLRTALGFKVTYDWKCGGLLIRPELRAAWQHEYGDTTYALDSSFANGAGGAFSVEGPKLGRDSALLGAGFAIQCSERCSTYFYYGGELGRKNYESNSVTGGVRLAF